MESSASGADIRSLSSPAWTTRAPVPGISVPISSVTRNLPEGRTRDQMIAEWLNKAAFPDRRSYTWYIRQSRPQHIPRSWLCVGGFGLFKRFVLTERVGALLRFEAFNVLNRVNLQGPNATQNNANFMRTTERRTHVSCSSRFG